MHRNVLTTLLPVLQVNASASGIKCQICHVVFLNQSAITDHYNSEHSGLAIAHYAQRGQGAHACDVCDKRYTTKQSLQRHMATVHAVGEAQTFKCDVCSREFNVKSNLTAHIKRMHNS